MLFPLLFCRLDLDYVLPRFIWRRRAEITELDVANSSKVKSKSTVIHGLIING